MGAFIIILICAILCTFIGILIFAIVKLCKTKQPKITYAYAQGEIMNVLSEPPSVVIHYVVHNQTYKLKEVLKMRSENIKVGEVTVGQKQVPVANAERGRTVIIQYDIKDPSMAFWVANR